MTRNLDDYNRMRDFSATSEPAAIKRRGRSKATEHALQFCIQKHDASHLHYDFRLELDGALKSWAVPRGRRSTPRSNAWRCMSKITRWITRRSRAAFPKGITAPAM
jgi:bifunctional non-homologous end joining protein LigD